MTRNSSLFKRQPLAHAVRNTLTVKSRSQSKLAYSALLLSTGLYCFTPQVLADQVPFDAIAQSIDDNLDLALFVVTGDIDNDGDQDVVAVGRYANTVAWYENAGDSDGETWIKHLIDNGGISGPTEVQIANMDVDPALEVVVSAAGDNGAADDSIYWYDAPAGGPDNDNWTKNLVTDFTVDNTTPPLTTTFIADPNSIAVLDIDGDGDQDIAAALFGSGKLAITWYENPIIAPPPAQVPPQNDWIETIIEANLPNPRFVLAANIDGDTFIDLVTASFTPDTYTGRVTWHESTSVDGTTWTQHTDLSTERGVSLAAANMNNDSLTDIVVALRLDNQVAILEHPTGGGGAPEAGNWNEVTVSTTVPQARSVVIGDIDNDGDQDIASAAFGTGGTGLNGLIQWHDNPQTGANTVWDTYVINQTALTGPATVALADIDGDGTAPANLDLDIVGAIFTDQTVNWYRNQRLTGIRITDVTNQPITAALSVTELPETPPPIAGLPSEQQQFQVELTSLPTAGTVTVPLVLPAPSVPPAPPNPQADEVTLSTQSLTFDTTDWNVPQVVTITSVNDAIDDGDQNFNISFGQITAPGDVLYNGVTPANTVAVTTVDDDVAGIIIDDPDTLPTVPPGAPPALLSTTEAGGADTFTIQLSSQPASNVLLDIVSSDITEGTGAPNPLTFTALNWNQPQTVTMTGVNDNIDDDNVAYTVQVQVNPTTIEPAYLALPLTPAINASNADDADLVGVNVSAISGPTSEPNGTATFTVVLNSEPTANITIAVDSSDPTEGTPSTNSLAFTAANWNVPQTVTVTGVNDAIDDDNMAYEINLGPITGTDTKYTAINLNPVAVTNNDDADQAGFTVTAVTNPTAESGTTATFTVRLNSEPTANIVIGVNSPDATEGSAAPASLIFTPANWNNPQTVTVTGQNDNLPDGNVPYIVVLSVDNSNGDTKYAGVTPPNVSLTNLDDDDNVPDPGVIVSQIIGSTTEAGGTASFTVSLNQNPSANVAITLASQDTTEGTAAPATLTFTPTTGLTPQVVTVTGVDDSDLDGNITYTIEINPISGTGTIFDGLDPMDVSVINNDNEAPLPELIFNGGFEGN